jgi:hypothetical protein
VAWIQRSRLINTTNHHLSNHHTSFMADGTVPSIMYDFKSLRAGLAVEYYIGSASNTQMHSPIRLALQPMDRSHLKFDIGFEERELLGSREGLQVNR